MPKSTSIYPLYSAISKGEISGFTVPAINIRTLTYDFARIIFRIMNEKSIGALIFEISPTEMQYTDQSLSQYAGSIMKAAEDENYDGPVFLQGDHFQINKTNFNKDRNKEVERIQNLINEALNANFLNIDIDSSTLVSLGEKDTNIAQKDNFEVTSLMTKYIREVQEEEIVSIGGEIGHIGDRNSTLGDLEAFMQGFSANISGIGLSKISVATGSTHGGTLLPSGELEKVKINFKELESLGRIAREKYGLGGVVQHGASTLPKEFFSKFKNAGTLEIHLSTGFQNTIYDNMNPSLREEIYRWIGKNCKDEWEEGWSKDQFIYRCRKKAFGPFKDKISNMSDKEKEPILKSLEEELRFLFESFGIWGTKEYAKICEKKKN